MKPCHCGTNAHYEACCGALHAEFTKSGHLAAPNAEALMRSRYSAYVLELAPYLLATWHASTRPVHLEFEPNLRWLGLEVKQHAQQDATHATVHFVARSKFGGRAHRLVETSRFVDEPGIGWQYLAADEPN